MFLAGTQNEGGERVVLEIRTSVENIEEVDSIVEKVEKIEGAHSCNCVLHVEIFSHCETSEKFLSDMQKTIKNVRAAFSRTPEG